MMTPTHCFGCVGIVELVKSLGYTELLHQVFVGPETFLKDLIESPDVLVSHLAMAL